MSPKTTPEAKVRSWGHDLAKRIQATKSREELEKLDGEIQDFCAFLDQNFSSDQGYRRDVDLATSLVVAVNLIKSSRVNPEDQEWVAGSDTYLQDFEEELDVGEWCEPAPKEEGGAHGT